MQRFLSMFVFLAQVLHWLASLRPSDVASRLMPMLIHAAIATLYEQDGVTMETAAKMLKHVVEKAGRLLRTSESDLKTFQELYRLISQVELVLSRAQSLKQKMRSQNEASKPNADVIDKFVSDALQQVEVAVTSGGQSSLGHIIHQLFKAAQKVGLKTYASLLDCFGSS